MSKATRAYVAFFAIFIIGMWLVLEIGARLSALNDFAGKWSIEPLNGGKIPGATTHDMFIEQSGKFFRINVDGLPRLDFVAATRESDQHGPTLLTMHWSGNDWQADVSGAPGSDDFDFHLSGPSSYDFHGHRLDRTYKGPDSPAARAQSSENQPTTIPSHASH